MAGLISTGASICCVERSSVSPQYLSLVHDFPLFPVHLKKDLPPKVFYMFVGYFSQTSVIKILSGLSPTLLQKTRSLEISVKTRYLIRLRHDEVKILFFNQVLAVLDHQPSMSEVLGEDVELRIQRLPPNPLPALVGNNRAHIGGSDVSWLLPTRKQVCSTTGSPCGGDPRPGGGGASNLTLSPLSGDPVVEQAI